MRGSGIRSRRSSRGLVLPAAVSETDEEIYSNALTTEIHRAIEAVWRIESARLIAGLARIVRDVGLAEDLAQDALVAALERWPESGVPDNPGAWLMATAKHRAIDRLRRNKRVQRKQEELGRELEVQQEMAVAALDAAIDGDIGDDLLRLTLQAAIAACHARARTPAETDWARIVALYDALAELTPSPVVELNRAVAVAMAFGPAAGLELVDALTSEPSLKAYHLLPSVRGDLLVKLGRFGEARGEFQRHRSRVRDASRMSGLERAIILVR